MEYAEQTLNSFNQVPIIPYWEETKGRYNIIE
jgi:hypothetical protein